MVTKDDKTHDKDEKSHDKWNDPPAYGAAPGAGKDTPKKATKPGFTMCKVTGTAIKYGGKKLPEGTVAEFDDATILEMPGVLVSVE